MEAAMKVFVLEGTPEEILTALPQLREVNTSSPAALAVRSPAEAATETDDGSQEGYVTTRVARRVLSRRSLKPVQRQVLEALYRSHPEQLLASELQELTGYTASQFAGLMGAFGRRVTHTKGYEDGDYFFLQEWDHEAGCMRYGLPESVREAMKLEQII